jgi:hypothetical protein
VAAAGCQAPKCAAAVRELVWSSAASLLGTPPPGPTAPENLAGHLAAVARLQAVWRRAALPFLASGTALGRCDELIISAMLMGGGR